jgi:hypothetical protein
MDVRRIRRTRRARCNRRVLLVGFPPLMLSGLEPAFSSVAEVVCVPFPGIAFDRAAEEFDPDLIVVDVTYLDESVVRPLITKRFAQAKPVVAYVSDQREMWVDDLQALTSGPLEDSSIPGLVALASGSPLSLVAER